MPRASPVLCKCGRVRQANTRCVCQPARVDTRASATKRGYDEEWKQAAKAFLAQHPRCQCGKPATCVAHRISIKLRPDLRMNRANWRPSCRGCNTRDWQRDKAGGVASPLAKRSPTMTPQLPSNSADYSGLPFAVLGVD